MALSPMSWVFTEINSVTIFFSKSERQSSLSPKTRLSNLYLTGQDVNFHGMVGVSLTAIMTAETIVGRNTIVNKINDTIWKQ